MALEDLLPKDDPDWASFQSGDPDYFLRVAGDTIRDFCGWHIWPNIAVIGMQRKLGSKGIITLPSRHVTSVDQVQIDLGSGWTPVDPSDYTWDVAGFIERRGAAYWDATAGRYYGNDPMYLPVSQANAYALVDFTHGFDTIPREVQSVGYELATNAKNMPAGVATEIDAPLGYKLLLKDLGATLTAAQCNRLAKYAIGRVG